MKFINLNKYGYLRIAAASPECKVADIDFNTDRIIEQINIAAKANANLVLFPELSITSYTSADLFFQNLLLTKALESLSKIQEASLLNSITVVVGLPIADSGRLFNCAVMISEGKIKGIVPKTYIPNNNEFYEARWFSSDKDRINDTIIINDEVIPFGADLVFNITNIPNAKIGIEICEDLWAVHPPSSDLALNGANVILNLSASNEYLGKAEYRRDLIRNQSARLNSAYIYSSAGPGESSTDILFSGHCIIAENGSILNESERFKFESNMIISDIDLDKLNSERIKNKTFGRSKPHNSFREISIYLEDKFSSQINRTTIKSPFVPTDYTKRAETCKEIFSIQATALTKRLKSINCYSLVLGLSGGLDSTLALLVALEAFRILQIDPKGIHCILMPGFGTTKRTKGNAELLCEHLGVTSRIISIDKAVKQHFADIGHQESDLSIVYENSQARERTQLLMDISNQVNGIVLGTGDLSEIALGWSTYNADHISMYNVNCGVPKTLVKYIVQWCADEKYQTIIASTLTDICNTPISPELLPPDENGNIIQETEKSVGSYILNDFFLYNFFRFNYSPSKLFLLAEIAFGDELSASEIKHWLKMFYTRFFRSQFKRTCVPDGPKIGSVALSPRGDWRMSTDSELTLWINEIDRIEI